MIRLPVSLAFLVCFFLVFVTISNGNEAKRAPTVFYVDPENFVMNKPTIEGLSEGSQVELNLAEGTYANELDIRGLDITIKGNGGIVQDFFFNATRGSAQLNNLTVQFSGGNPNLFRFYDCDLVSFNYTVAFMNDPQNQILSFNNVKRVRVVSSSFKNGVSLKMFGVNSTSISQSNFTNNPGKSIIFSGNYLESNRNLFDGNQGSSIEMKLGDLKDTNSVFQNNQASCISLNADSNSDLLSVDVMGAAFNNNSATLGAGIMALSGNVTSISLRRSTFNQHVSDLGTSIYVSTSSTPVIVSTILVEGSSFDHSTGSGAVYLESPSSSVNLSVKNCNFTNGIGPSSGIHLTGKIDCVISDSKFINNYCTASDTGALGIYSPITALVIRCTFKENYAPRVGAAMSLYWSNQFTLENNTIDSNWGTAAGIVYLFGATVVSKGNVYRNNSQQSLFVDSSSMNSYNDIFLDSPQSGQTQVLVSTSVYKTKSCRFEGGKASSGVRVKNDAGSQTSYYSESDLFINNAGDQASGIYVDSSDISVFVFNTTFISNANPVINLQGNTLNLDRVKFIRNRGVNGVILQTGGIINSTKCEFDSNDVAVHLMMFSSIQDVGSSFINSNGSHILAECYICEIYLSQSLLKGGRSDYGGAIRTNASAEISIDSCVFDSNTARFDGGAIYSNQNNARFTLTNSNFTNQRAGRDGGSIYALVTQEGESIMQGLRFTNSTAVGNGGGILLDNSKRGNQNLIQLQTSQFVGCSASQGGAIASIGSMKVENSSFSSNRGRGSNFFLLTPSSISITNSQLSDRRSVCLPTQNGTLTGENNDLKLIDITCCSTSQPFAALNEDGAAFCPAFVKQEVIKEKIDTITEAKKNDSAQVTTLFNEVVSSYFQNKTATNPLVYSTSNISFAAFDLRRNNSQNGNQKNVSFTVGEGSVSFPISLTQNLNEVPAYVVFYSFSQTPYGFNTSNSSSPIPQLNIYALSLVSDNTTTIKVENTQDPFEIYMNIPANSTQEQRDNLECIFWDEDENQWDNDGCIKGPESNATLLQCLCYHLTNFTGGASPKKTDPVVTPVNNDTKSFPLGLVVGLVVGLSLLVFIVVAIVIVVVLKKKKKEKKLSSMVLNVFHSDEKLEDKLEIKETISTKDYASVYRVLQSGTTTVAMKKLNNDAMRQNFIKEGNIMKSLHHPNIVQYLAMFESKDGSLGMTMEYVDGGNLHHCLKKDLPIDYKFKILKQVTAAMRYLVESGVVHGKISSNNVLLNSAKDTAKLCDFEFARRANEKGETKQSVPTRWSSPEVLKDNCFTYAGDVFSFGVLLWEVCSTGNVPYLEMNEEQVVRFVVGGGRLSKPECKEGEVLYPLMQQCWKEDPNARPKIEEVSESLFQINEQDVNVEGTSVSSVGDRGSIYSSRKSQHYDE
eukprot:TRINITY_DN3263_c0_g1_i1.p1 TRINITY_DN3263_c0_g1~~TRINITY_DN3263_c0_g1_i1.p1  ORF type:complete len:1409 (+),score=398.97 TRINITY_DN3263_c0_g1_i1:312-4538(+)